MGLVALSDAIKAEILLIAKILFHRRHIANILLNPLAMTVHPKISLLRSGTTFSQSQSVYYFMDLSWLPAIFWSAALLHHLVA
eukprot:CCRYP_007297-RA/>CCRYP_007297-RA protein AED:0.45 eAED:0.90 QI:53/0/0/1/0/0/2/0/82